MIAVDTYGHGIDALFECGIRYQKLSYNYQLVRNWAVALVPVMGYICQSIKPPTGQFVLGGHLDYYLRQASLFITLLMVRLLASTMLYLSSLDEVINFSKASDSNLELRSINACLSAFEVLALLVIVKTDEKTFFKVFRRPQREEPHS